MGALTEARRPQGRIREEDPVVGSWLLVDGTAVAYRAFHAIRGLSTRAGEPTNAVFGVAKSVQRWLRLHEPEFAAVVFDRGRPEYRMKVLPEYKAQRPAMPDDLARQFPLIEELLNAHGVPVVVQEGVEADDIIARLALDAVAAGATGDAVDPVDAGDEVVVVTSDKDMLPLVARGIRIVLPHREDAVCDSAYVRERYGIAPGQMTDWLALTGDSSDNIPGVPGVGAKTAARLLTEFGSAEALLAGVARVGNARVRRALEEHADDLRRNIEVVRLRPEVVAPVSNDDLRLRTPDRPRLVTLLRELEFGSMLAELTTDDARQGDLPLG